MLAVARLWTWIGQLFVPIAFAWAYFVRNGPGEGVLISRGYLGLLASLAAGSALAWTLGSYVRLAKLRDIRPAIPPNTMFEDDANRSMLISWGTLVVFTAVCLAALLLFGVRYSDSRIHQWDDPAPLDHSFAGSRVKAHESVCHSPPCFAMSARKDVKGNVLPGDIFEYIPYVTDGGIVALATVLLSGLIFLGIMTSRRRPPPMNWEL
jgi:hypothetical protein